MNSQVSRSSELKMKFLKPTELDSKIKNLANQERELLAEIISVIQEIDIRKIYLQFGFPNLYAYLTEGVGYSAASAQRRIDAARLLKEIPDLNGKIESGEINLSQISLMQKTIREVQKSRSVKVSSADKKTLINELVDKNQKQSQVKIATFFDQPILSQSKQRFQADESVRLELTLSKELYEKIQKAQELVSHNLSSKDLKEFLSFVSDKIIRQKLGKKNSLQKTGSAVLVADSKTSTSAAEVKSIPAATKKSILGQHQGCCFVDSKTGKKCGSRWHLQIDHIHTRWAGGDNSAKNLQVLCAAHNRMKYRIEQKIQLMS